MQDQNGYGIALCDGKVGIIHAHSATYWDEIKEVLPKPKNPIAFNPLTILSDGRIEEQKRIDEEYEALALRRLSHWVAQGYTIHPNSLQKNL